MKYDDKGLCSNQKCMVNGPRCEFGACRKCCAVEHDGWGHLPPPDLGAYTPAEATLYNTAKITEQAA